MLLKRPLVLLSGSMIRAAASNRAMPGPARCLERGLPSRQW
jgi:hypothetical protein